MFCHDRLRRMVWDDKWDRAITGLWGVAWTEWIAIAFLWVLVWRHGHAVLHHRPHAPGVALAAAQLPVLGVVAKSTTRRRGHTWTTARWPTAMATATRPPWTPFWRSRRCTATS
jgi:hypothetical protein